jgi:hypothetical protein
MIAMWRFWFFLMVSMVSSALALAQPRYLLIPLEGLPSALDPSGPLVGTGAVLSDEPGRPEHPALFTEAGPVLLGLLPDGLSGHGAGVCGAFTTGYASTGPFGLRTHAFLAVAGESRLRDLGDGDRFSAGAAVNCQGEVAGYADDPTLSRIVPVWWDVDGDEHILPTFQNSGTSVADAINEAGDIIGNAPVGANSHCVWWPADTRAIQDCGVDPSGNDFSFGMGLSNNGPHMVGPFFVVGDTTPQRGFLREPDGTIVPLSPLPGEAQSIAVGINDAGLIVGWSATNPPSAGLPFSSQCTLWQDDDSAPPPTPVALSALVTNGEDWELRQCLGVNRNGVLLGEGTRQGVRTAFLAIPITEVVEEPPVESPASPPPAKRHQKDKPAHLADLLAHWQRHREVSLGKIARWEAQVKQWQARHRK